MASGAKYYIMSAVLLQGILTPQYHIQHIIYISIGVYVYVYTNADAYDMLDMIPRSQMPCKQHCRHDAGFSTACHVFSTIIAE